MSGVDKEKGRFVKHMPCMECPSSDAHALYLNEHEDGDSYSSYCFSCGDSKSHNELIESGIIDKDFVIDKTKLKEPKSRVTRKERIDLVKRTNYNTKMLDGSLYRGIKSETAEFYSHRFERNSDGEIFRVYYPETVEGEIVGYKTRVLPKRFGIGNLGCTGSSSDLSGMHKFPNGGRSVIIVGGEEDKLAAFQMMRDYQISRGHGDYDPIAVVAPTSGEGSAAKQCRNHYEWLDSFESIVVCLDNDEAGHKATEELLKVLPDEKTKVMKLSGKDPNQMLLDGKAKQFVSNYYDAKPVIDDGIKSSVDAQDEVYEYLTAPKITLPPYLHRLQDAMRGGIRSTGVIVNIIGDTSIGKTYFSDNLNYHWLYHSPLVPTIVSLERTAGELMVDLLGIHLEHNLTWYKEGSDAIEYLNKPEVVELRNDLTYNEYGEPRFHIIDERTGDVKHLMNQVERISKQYDSKLIIFDPISDFTRSLPLNEQEDFYLWQKQMAKNGLVIINIQHTRKGSSESKDGSFKRVTEYDALGTSSSVQSAHINIVLNRNKMATDPMERNTTYVSMPKCRGGDTGEICELYYDHKTRQQYDKRDYLEKLYGKDEAGEELETDQEPLNASDSDVFIADF